MPQACLTLLHCRPVSFLSLSSEAVHQRILGGLTSPASASASKSFLFPPGSSPSARDKENHPVPSTPQRSLSHSTFHLSPSSAFSPVGSPAASSLSKRRKTAHTTPPTSLGRTFHSMAMESEVSTGDHPAPLGRSKEPMGRERRSRSRSGTTWMPR